MDLKTVFEFSPLVVAVVPIVIGLVEVLKGVGLTSKYAPAFSLVFGIWLMLLIGMVWQAAIIQGIIAGLAASGLYSGAKKSLEKE